MELLETITCTLSDTKETILNALSNTREYLRDFFDEETTLTRKTIAIICVICILCGIVYGFLISPIKRGIHINIDHSKNIYRDDEENCK